MIGVKIQMHPFGGPEHNLPENTTKPPLEKSRGFVMMGR